MLKFILYIITIVFTISCTSKTIYSGKIINQEDLSSINFKNKETLINKLGNPSFIDPINNKFYYFSEQKVKKSAYNKKINYSYVFVFDFDKNSNVSNTKVYNLKNKKEIELIKDETNSNIIKRGLLEKIFGGVGPQQELTTSP